MLGRDTYDVLVRMIESEQGIDFEVEGKTN